jgi:DNA-binding transcriptional MerR regulator
MDMNDTFSIAEISQETGIAKEVLRKWEVRYSFPLPARNSNGRRLYSAAQVQRLKQIKALVDGGMRPGQVVPLDAAQRSALLAQIQQTNALESPSQMVCGLLKILQDRDLNLLRKKLKQKLLHLGLKQFILDIIQPLNIMIGDAWAKGDLTVREEHIYTEIVSTILREEISKLSTNNGTPRVALMTVPDELHTLGILMVEAMILINGGSCISLGAQIPLDQITPTVHDYQIDIVGFSFSTAFPIRRISPWIKEIRQILPVETTLWVGGAGVATLKRTPKGVLALPDLQQIDGAIAQFRKYHCL